MTIDLTEPLGRIRMATGDTTSWPVLSDQQIEDVISSVEGNEEKATRLCAQYILASISTRSDYRLDRIAIIGNTDTFNNYLR